MDNETLRKVQLAQLEIAREIKRVCTENGIQYFMDSGTLLGAVRHRGFIPWDDDMDFGMLRSEYEKFLKIAPKALDKKYFLQTWITDPNYPYAFAKIRKLGTIFQEVQAIHTNAHNEIYVDIFPYDVYPDNEKQRKKLQHRIMMYRYAIMMKRKNAPWLNHESLLKRVLVRIKYIPATAFSLFYSGSDLIKRMSMIMKQYNEQSSKKYYLQGSSYCGKWSISRECFEQLVELPFEDTTFLAPSGYVQYLTEAFGDYMTPPPKEKRGNQHKIIDVKL